MQQRPLGNSGIRVGRLALGTMNWGRTTDEYEARDQLAAFLDAGGTLIDTADVYAEGVSEQLLGTLIQEFECRDSDCAGHQGGLVAEHRAWVQCQPWTSTRRP